MPASAESAIIFGFVQDIVNSKMDSSQDLDALQQVLQERLQRPVRFRTFSNQDILLDWLILYRGVDFACLDSDWIETLPVGETVYVGGFAVNSLILPGGQCVARQDADPSLVSMVSTVMADLPVQFRAQQASPPSDQSVITTAQTTPLEPRPNGAEAQSPNAQSVAELLPEDLDNLGPGVVAAGSDATADEPEAGNPQTPDATERTTAQPEEDDQPVSLQADTLSYDEESERYQAKGDVHLTRGTTVLSADQLIWQETTQDAVAKGTVTLSSAQGHMTGTSLHYNMATGQGQLRDGRIFLKDGNFHLTGADIDQVGTASYRVVDGSFTTCDGEVPDWKFTADKVAVNNGDYTTARNVWFHLNDVPVFYTPYLVFPVKNERSSGLLMPQYGQSREQGTVLSASWYQVIDRNMDATFQLDYMSKLGLGKGLEYRYLLGRDNRGTTRFYHVSGFNDFPNMYAFDWLHGGTLPGDIWLSADVQYVNDKKFYENFGEVAEEYNKDKTVSEVWLQRNWDKLNAVLRGRYIEDLEESNGNTLQRLPELGVSLIPYRIGSTPLFPHMESYLTNFTRDEGEEGQRLFLHPALSASFKFGPWLEFVPEVGFYQRNYDTNEGKEDLTVPEVSATIATRLQRVFALGDEGTKRLMHSIEPQVTYRYLPDKDEEDLPIFDLKDRITPFNRLDYALVNRFTLRTENIDGVASYREFMELRLSQFYDINEAREDFTEDEDNQPFSDLRVELYLQPTRRTRLAIDSWIKMYGQLGFSKFRASAAASDTKGNRVSANYVYRDNDIESLRTNYVSMSLDTALLNPIFVHLEDRYSIDDSEELEKVVAIEYRSQCWSIFLTYRDRIEDEVLLLSFALSGVGRTSQFGGRIGSSAED